MTKMIELISESVPSPDKANELLTKLVEVSNAAAVFSPAVEAGDFKVITASEVSIALGYGYGGGAKFGDDEDDSEMDTEGTESESAGFGSGGGGGGSAVSRPVAAIEVGPYGVRVKPIIDPTKIIVTFFTTLVGIFMMGSKIKRSLGE